MKSKVVLIFCIFAVSYGAVPKDRFDICVFFPNLCKSKTSFKGVYIQFHITDYSFSEDSLNYKHCITMLQKLSKCEVKAWLWWSLIILPSLWFYVKSNFGEFKRPKNVIFCNFKASELWILVNLELEKLLKFSKKKIRTSKIAKNDIFWSCEIAQIWFHVKS